jgi:hypothetical protein
MKPGTTAVAGAGTARVAGSRSVDVDVDADVTVAVAVAVAAAMTVTVAVLRERLDKATGLDLPATQRDRGARPPLGKPVAVTVAVAVAAAAAAGRRTARGGARPHESGTLPSTGRAFALTPAPDSGQPSTSTPRSRP